MVLDWTEYKNTKFYKNAIECWTIRDTNKLQTAKNNNLNYLVFYTYNDFETFILKSNDTK
jgi:hypothetical protein